MEDLLEELLNVLAPPSGTASAHKEIFSPKQLAPSNGTATQKTQVNGFLASQKMAPKTARKATEKMSQKAARQSDKGSNTGSDTGSDKESGQGSDQIISDSAVSDSAVSNGSSTLMRIASLSNLATDQLLKTAQSLNISTDALQEMAVESRLFDAGVAVPKALGHQVFSAKDEPVHEASFEIDEQDALPESIETANENAVAADGSDIELSLALEDSAEIDESVMSAFDIGDFEADTHATQDADASSHTAGDFDSTDFNPDDFELDHLHLEALGFGAGEYAEAHSEGDFYDADERSGTADISLDELVGATEQNFLTRWFKRLVGKKAADPEAIASEPSEPKLFESDYSQRETQSTSAAHRDAEYDADFYTELAPDEEADDFKISENFESFEAFEVCERADEVKEQSELLKVAEDSDLLDVLEIFEPDALEGTDEDGFDEDSLLDPLGEKAWLSEADNANESLQVAAAAGDRSGVWAALAANASVNALGLAQRTALSVAIEAGHLPVVEMLLEMCADPNVADRVNGSPVRYPLMVAATEAAESSRGDLLRLLLARGAEVNQVDVMGQTALMGAAERGHVDAMRRLIEANADLDAADLLGQTAMLRARGQGHEGAIALLQSASMDRERAIAFLKAVTQGDLAAVEQWLAAGISANTRVARMSALTQAAAKGEVAIARLLIEAGADVDYRFYETDPTPLFHAAYRGQLEMVALLLEAGASPRLSSGYPIGALDYAEIGRQKSDDAAAFEPIMALLATLATRPS